MLDIAATETRRGRFLAGAGRIPEAESAYARALEFAEQVHSDFPGEPSYQGQVAEVLKEQGRLAGEVGSAEKAEPLFQRAITLAKALVEQDPKNLGYRVLLAGAYQGYGVMLQRNRRLPEAEKADREHLKHRQALVDAAASDPSLARHSPAARHELSSAHGNLAYLWAIMGKYKEAEQAYRQAIETGKTLVSDFPERPDYRKSQANRYNNFGIFHNYGQRPKEAITAFQEAVALWRSLVKEFPNDSEYHSGLGAALSNWAGTLSLHDPGGLPQARQLLQEAVDHQAIAINSNPRDETYRQYLDKHLEFLESVLANLGETKAAIDLSRRRVADAEKAAKEAFTSANRRRLGHAQHSLGRSYRLAKEYTDAENHYQVAITIQKQLITDYPRDPGYRSDLALSLHDYSITQWHKNDFQKALTTIEEAIVHQRAALAPNPGHSHYRDCLLNHYGSLVITRISLGHHAEVVKVANVLITEFPDQIDAYSWAKHVARCVPLAEKDHGLSPGERRMRAQAYADRAMEFLQQAAKKGRVDLTELKMEEVFEPLRKREDFQKLLRELGKMEE
jgi:tetratricopeptide (TPR) repeat protein